MQEEPNLGFEYPLYPQPQQQQQRSVDIKHLLNPSSPPAPPQFVFPPLQPPPAPQTPSPSGPRLFIKLPPMAMTPNTNPGLRRSSRHRTASDSAGPSGSEYHESDKSVDMDHDEPNPNKSPPPDSPKIEYTTTKRGRQIAKRSYVESMSEDDGVHASDLFKDDDDEEGDVKPPRRTRGRYIDDEDEEEEGAAPRYSTRRTTRGAKLDGFVISDEEDHPRYPLRLRKTKPPPPGATRSSSRTTRHANSNAEAGQKTTAAQRATRLSRRTTRAAAKASDDVYVQHSSSGASASGSPGSLDDAPHTSSDVDADADADADGDLVEVDEPGEEDVGVDGGDGRPYALRQRAKINYAIPPPLEEMVKPPKARAPGGGGGRNGWGGGGGGGGGGRTGKGKGLGWSASGAELGRWMGMPGDDSDSDYNTRTPRKPFGGAGGGAAGVFGGGAVASAGGAGMFPSDLAAAAGTPSNLGKIGDSALADADPLGVNTNVTFDEVGGLDDHIHSLKEMTLLPLLYPEVFQRFNVTPPRGVLFHGPPGTGKTLLARALAASCRTNGKQISFFMRKGADCLSKWVGEAERQLRLLFEEARSCQPSIIFFDEIDGLAPVRSSKQDQIHASIVSTLLALMDGMDGRGQVVVIGATNRPDAVDPALRRPGRFDREFYFPLPGLEARERILGIMTRGWEGWGDGEGEEKAKENVKGLARLTKGYGGADLRALCTEAALNAVQRRYPQIYKSNDRLLVKPETIGVGLRDFMISVKKLVPSSARSSSSAATPLPPQFVPLLEGALEDVKKVIGRVLPVDKKRTALEEAEYEDVEGEQGALEREMSMQSMETLRVYRPRMILHGPVGMGQGYVGAAALHYLEGYHVQSLELGSLMGDSARTVEAAIVQLFVEAKRHQPSVIYIPSLVGWCAAVSETSRSTVRAMLDTLAPTDPILLLAIVDGKFSQLPRDVKSWFGPTRDNRVELKAPSKEQREEFFKGLIGDVVRPPNEFADGVKRRMRVLEVLPVAPPLEPRQPTAAELAVQEDNDQRIITLLKYRLGPILTELKRKFKRFTKRATEEYNFDPVEPVVTQVETVTTIVEVHPEPNGVVEVVEEEHVTQPVVNGHVNGIIPEQPPPVEQPPPLYDMDLERMHTELYKGKYLTPQEFLDDVGKIVHNAGVRMDEDLERLYKAQAMFTATQVSIHDFDPQFRMECERMATRERKRREEHRKNRGKGKASEDANGNGNSNVLGAGTRRSARNNGQQPEIPITDPVKLERRLKRQRSDEAAADSLGSEEENAEGRKAKRTKMIVSDDEDRDPLDIVGPTPQSQPRPMGVRFAKDIEPMETIGEMSPLGPVLPPPQPGDLEPMVIDVAPRRSLGFDPFLLNPLSPTDNPFLVGSSSMNGIESQATLPPTTQSTTSDPFLSQPTQPPTQPLDDIPSPPRTPDRSSEPRQLERQPSPIPMVIERSPTPPHADFHVDEAELSQIKELLRDQTWMMTIEQLEQLRATCLGCVWRHRSEWDRDMLLKEIQGIIKDFVEDVTDDCTDSDGA